MKLAIILAAFFFGLFFFKDQFFFYYDQGRDAYEAYSIYHDKDLKIQGPGTDIPGLYHGVLWYYFLSVSYLLGGENPLFAGLFLFFLIFATMPVIWRLSFSMFGDRNLSFAILLLYAFSPALQIGSRWLSNPSLALVIVPILLFSLWKFSKKKNLRDAFLIGVLSGLLLHANLAYLICLMSIPLICIVLKIRVKVSEFFYFTIGLLLALLPIILSEVKFKGRGVQSLTNHFTQSSSFNITELIKTVIHKFTELLNLSFFGADSILILAVLFILILIAARKISDADKKPLYFLLAWMISLLPFFLFDTGISRSKFVLFPYLIPTIILFVFILRKTVINQKIFILAVALLLIIQLKTNLGYIVSKTNPYTVQKGMVITDLKRAIDYTYQESFHQEFIINSITSPLFINTTWAYLYEFYGARKYGYLPKWDGKDQTGYLGNLPEGINAPFRFTIIEPGPGIPEIFIKETIQEEDIKSRLVSEKRFGNIIVQKRIPKE